MKRVLVIITTAFVPYGGLTNSFMNYYRAIDKSELRIDIASTNNAEGELINELFRSNSKYYCLGNRKRKFVSYIRRLESLLSAGHYDVIHVHGNSSTMLIELFLAKKVGIKKRIAHCHTSKSSYILLNWVLHPLFVKLYTDAIAVSDNSGKYLFGTDYCLLRNAIDVDNYSFSRFSRTVIRKKYGIEEKDFVIGHVGKIYEPKNHLFLLTVFNEYIKLNKNCKLLIVGDGVLRKEVEKRIRSLNLQDYVIITGLKKNIPDYLSAMDCFVFPSLWEGMPLSLVEAQASGLKCVISDRIDKSVVFNDSCSVLSLDDEIRKWVDVINSAEKYDRDKAQMWNKKEIRNMGFDIQSNSEKLRKIYNE